jgi:hypothetical protein
MTFLTTVLALMAASHSSKALPHKRRLLLDDKYTLFIFALDFFQSDFKSGMATSPM